MKSAQQRACTTLRSRHIKKKWGGGGGEHSRHQGNIYALHKQGRGGGVCKSIEVAVLLRVLLTAQPCAARAAAAATLLGGPGAGRPGAVERRTVGGRLPFRRLLAAQRRPALGPAATGLGAPCPSAGLCHVGVQFGVQVAPGACHVRL